MRVMSLIVLFIKRKKLKLGTANCDEPLLVKTHTYCQPAQPPMSRRKTSQKRTVPPTPPNHNVPAVPPRRRALPPTTPEMSSPHQLSRSAHSPGHQTPQWQLCL